jgi:Peptidase M15
MSYPVSKINHRSHQKSQRMARLQCQSLIPKIQRNQTAPTKPETIPPIALIANQAIVKPDPTKPAKPGAIVDPNKPNPVAPAEAKKAIDTTPEDTTSLWSRIKSQEGAEVQIEAGFPPLLYNKLVGKAYRIGRRMPDGIVLEIVDMSSAAQSTAPTITNSTDPSTAAANVKVPDGPVLDAAGKPILKPDGKPYLISEGKPLLDAAKKPVMGTDGKPVMTLLDAKGEPILGTDKKPIVVKAPPSLPASSTAANPTNPIANPPATTSTIPSVSIPPKSQQAAIAAAATSNSKITPTVSAQSVAKGSGLKFESKTESATGGKGSIGLNISALSTAVKDAAKQGDVVVVDGNTVKQIAPGAGTPTGLIIDWNQHKSIFVRKPVVMKKTPNHLAGGTGVMAVQGWDVNGKQMVGGFAVVPGQFTPVPGGKINVPEWGSLKMSDPIVPGCLYTWGDATKEGNRVPESKAIVKGIIEIAQQLMVFHGQGMNGGKKATVNSWYRDPTSNAACGGSSKSTHMNLPWTCISIRWINGLLNCSRNLRGKGERQVWRVLLSILIWAELVTLHNSRRPVDGTIRSRSNFRS